MKNKIILILSIIIFVITMSCLSHFNILKKSKNDILTIKIDCNNSLAFMNEKCRKYYMDMYLEDLQENDKNDNLNSNIKRENACKLDEDCQLNQYCNIQTETCNNNLLYKKTCDIKSCCAKNAQSQICMPYSDNNATSRADNPIGEIVSYNSSCTENTSEKCSNLSHNKITIHGYIKPVLKNFKIHELEKLFISFYRIDNKILINETSIMQKTDEDERNINGIYYEISNIPIYTNMIIKVGDNNNEFIDTYEYYFIVTEDNLIGKTAKKDLNVVSKIFYNSIQKVGDQNIGDDKGLIIGKVKDCKNFEVNNAIIGLSKETGKIVYFDENELVPDTNRYFTSINGMFAILNVIKGKISITSTIKDNESAIIYEPYYINMIPGSASYINLRGPTQNYSCNDLNLCELNSDCFYGLECKNGVCLESIVNKCDNKDCINGMLCDSSTGKCDKINKEIEFTCNGDVLKCSGFYKCLYQCNPEDMECTQNCINYSEDKCKQCMMNVFTCVQQSGCIDKDGFINGKCVAKSNCNNYVMKRCMGNAMLTERLNECKDSTSCKLLRVNRTACLKPNMSPLENSNKCSFYDFCSCPENQFCNEIGDSAGYCLSMCDM